ncbi:hypothetical protein NIES21_37690 [Anabaenopsis circularis NIES-21]|uniref:Uncharacterized protein n=2 Tax=Nostocales TaxID=1161 RepID=A0A1Z4GKN6_9CYAN|nr:hypothetical protein [Nostoc cycadae]BAY17926.1 hypothetical protein NIES21_37690 [Anabaenopsis circularis NIES-21]GBE91478.1 hypothetical protein NCWK1_1202 [Nostoc cycadae WK-1]
MKIIPCLSRSFTLQLLAFTAISSATTLKNNSLSAYAQETPTIPQATTQRICSLDPVEDLLPPPQAKTSNSLFSYLAQEGFTQSKDGSWVCYVNDPKKEGRYYTLFKVQEQNGKLIGSSFLDGGTLIEGQDNRTLDFFMKLIEHHLDGDQENRQSIRRYLESFISLVKEGKIAASRRGFLFDQPNRALVLYHTLGTSEDTSTGKLKGTAITLNIQIPDKVNSNSTKNGRTTSLRENIKPNQK